MKIRQIAIGCQDLERAKDFYTKLLGTEPLAVFNPPGFCFFDLAGTRLLIEVNGPQSLIYLEVDDVQKKVAELREQGFTISSEPHIVFPDLNGIFDTPGNEWLAFVDDSEGNHLGLMSREVI